MSERLYLFDGMSFAFRSFFAIKAALTDAEGRPTNAVYGFARTLLKILREHEPSHAAVVFDHPGKTFRDELYAEYKATRRETPPELLEQFPRMHALVEALDIPLLCIEGVEADDVMGTLARAAEKAGMEAVLVTGDKDMLQLVTDAVRVFDPAKGDNGLWCGPEEVRERFGTPPEHVVDALALIGDAADNVPGVRGIGDKTAKKLLEQFGNLEGLYENIDSLKGKQKERLIEDKDQAFFSRQLVTIKTDVPVPDEPAALARRAMDPAKAVDALHALGFNSLIEELFPGADSAEVPLKFTLIRTEEDLQEILARIREAGECAVDTETDSPDPMRARLVGISLSAAAGEACYIPIAHGEASLEAAGETENDGPPLTPERAIELLRPILEDPGIGKIGHNIKFDLIVFARAGIALAGIAMDTMVASYLTDPSRLRHNLSEVSLQYLRRKLTPITDLIGKGAKAITFDQVPLDRACAYACEDAEAAFQLTRVFREQLRARSLDRLYEDIEQPLIPVLARMEQAGIAIDLDVFAGLNAELAERLEKLARGIFELAGEAFNINSPKQLQTVLFDKLGLKPLRKTKTGYSTDVDVLEALAREHPLPEKILAYRTLEKLRGTYVEALPKLVNPETGRIHTSFNQAVAATGRLSSSDPNLQNIPVRGDVGRRIREGFIPGGPDWRLISADYSQIELRILAHLSGDERLCAAFHEDADIHRDTAARVFGVEPEALTPEMRRQAKAVNFGVVYGISAFGLARNLGIAQGEAQRFIDAYFAQYPKVRAWLDATLEQAREQGYVTTLMQRRRYLPELSGGDNATRRGAERAAINTPVQGSAADIIKRAMIDLDAALSGGEARLLLQVHDELIVETPADRAEAVAAQMRGIMGKAFKLSVPLKVDVGIGNNWAAIH